MRWGFSSDPAGASRALGIPFDAPRARRYRGASPRGGVSGAAREAARLLNPLLRVAMPGLKTRREGSPGGPFRFRVSDALRVPLRGHLLRLRLLDGQPSAKDLKPGSLVRIEGPDGQLRDVRVKSHAAMGGGLTQQRLDREREVDLVVAEGDAEVDGVPVRIGWHVAGPASSE